MAEYIDREALLLRIDCHGTNKFGMIDEDIRAFVKAQPAADVAPVVRCKDCKHSWEDIGGLCCSHGACVDLTVPGDFYCAYGERAEVTTIICQSCGAKMDGEPCTPSK